MTAEEKLIQSQKKIMALQKQISSLKGKEKDASASNATDDVLTKLTAVLSSWKPKEDEDEELDDEVLLEKAKSSNTNASKFKLMKGSHLCDLFDRKFCETSDQSLIKFDKDLKMACERCLLYRNNQSGIMLRDHPYLLKIELRNLKLQLPRRLAENLDVDFDGTIEQFSKAITKSSLDQFPLLSKSMSLLVRPQSIEQMSKARSEFMRKAFEDAEGEISKEAQYAIDCMCIAQYLRSIPSHSSAQLIKSHRDKVEDFLKSNPHGTWIQWAAQIRMYEGQNAPLYSKSNLKKRSHDELGSETSHDAKKPRGGRGGRGGGASGWRGRGRGSFRGWTHTRGRGRGGTGLLGV